MLLFLFFDEMSVQQDGRYGGNYHKRNNDLFIPLHVVDEDVDNIGETVTDGGNGDGPDEGRDEVDEEKTAGLHVGASEEHENDGAETGEEPHDEKDEVAVLMDDLVG